MLPQKVHVCWNLLLRRAPCSNPEAKKEIDGNTTDSLKNSTPVWTSKADIKSLKLLSLHGYGHDFYYYTQNDYDINRGLFIFYSLLFVVNILWSTLLVKHPNNLKNKYVFEKWFFGNDASCMPGVWSNNLFKNIVLISEKCKWVSNFIDICV